MPTYRLEARSRRDSPWRIVATLEAPDVLTLTAAYDTVTADNDRLGWVKYRLILAPD